VEKQGNVARFQLMKAVLIVIFLFASIMSACTDSTTAAGAPMELKLAHFFPATHPAETVLVKDWAAAIKEATGGKIVITSYPGETLAKAANIYNEVIEGVADIGLSCFSYNVGRFPEMEAFEQPGVVYKNSKVASKVAWEGVKELNPKCVQDTKLLMVIATGPGDLFTKTPVRKLEDLKGLQIRATGLTAETLEMAGAIPVGMPQSEAYDALQKGIASGNLAPVEVLKAWKHAEVTDYLTRTPFMYNNLFYITMNLNKWNSIPENIRKTITDVTEKYFEDVGMGLWDKQNEEALNWAINDQGMEVIELSPEETERWIKAIEPMQGKYIAKTGESGRKALEVVKKLAEKYNGEY
jgi:TRAP-type C4-dicarboxylate transport system substrate-binding protein